MLNRKVSDLPANYPLSIAKIISDQYHIAQAEINYSADIWHLMETMRLVLGFW